MREKILCSTMCTCRDHGFSDQHRGFQVTFSRTTQICHSWNLRSRFKKQSQFCRKCWMAAIEVEANAKFRKSLIGRSRPKVIGAEGSHLWVSHRATAMCERTGWDGITSREGHATREMMMRRGAGGSGPETNTWTSTGTTRSDWTVAALDRGSQDRLHRKNSNDKPHTTATSTAGHRTTTAATTAAATTSRDADRPITTGTPTESSFCRGYSPKRARNKGERLAWCLKFVWRLSQAWWLGPEDIPIPDADDLVIEIQTDQISDFDEHAGHIRSD